MRKNIYNSFIFLILFTTAHSCSPYYDAGKSYFKDNDKIVSHSQLLDFNIPIKINFSGSITSNDKKYKVMGIIKLKDYNNFQIYISSKTLGFEIARIEFFDDSIYFQNRYNKTSFCSNLNEVSYLKGLQLDSRGVLRLMSGRSSNNMKLVLKPDSTSYSYNSLSHSGIIKFNNIGYVDYHKLTVGTRIIEVEYDQFYRKYKLPFRINGSIYGNDVVFQFDLKYTSISTLKSNYLHLHGCN